MEPLEIVYDRIYDENIPDLTIHVVLNVEATLQAIIDRVNELTKVMKNLQAESEYYASLENPVRED